VGRQERQPIGLETNNWRGRSHCQFTGSAGGTTSSDLGAVRRPRALHSLKCSIVLLVLDDSIPT